MADYEYIFSTLLHKKLKEKIVGHIYVAVRNDILITEIDTIGGIKIDISINDFANKLVNGYSTDYAAYEIAKEYKKKRYCQSISNKIKKGKFLGN